PAGEFPTLALARNMEYVLACCGDRRAMAAMSKVIGTAIEDACAVEPAFEDRFGPLKVAAQGWMRLSMATMAFGDDPSALADAMFHDSIIDLRYLDDFAAKSKLLVPDIGSERLKIEGQAIQTWRQDRYAVPHWVSTYNRPPVRAEVPV